MMLSQIIKACDINTVMSTEGSMSGKSTFGIDGDYIISNICTDTRKLDQDDVFVALKGENFNGHEFVNMAKKKGACAAIVSEKVDVPVDDKFCLLYVDNTLIALADIAKLKRSQFEGAVIAVTGSCGKTTVKDMLVGILSLSGTVHATQGNFNNEVGVPLTLLDLNKSNNFAVIEAGAGKLNDIAYLVDIIQPNVSLVNNVMSAHIEGFGSEKNIATEKFKLYCSSLLSSAVVNLDNSYASLAFDVIDKTHDVSNNKHRSFEGCLNKNSHCIGFSMYENVAKNYLAKGKVDKTVYAKINNKNINGCVNFDLHIFDNTEFFIEQGIQLGVIGEHQVANALAAVSGALSVGISLQHIKQGLEAFSGVKSRMQPTFLIADNVIIDDTYNANPGSVKAAINYLSEQKKSILILGDMAELGINAEKMHSTIGEYAKQKDIAAIWVLGKFSRSTAEGFGNGAKVFSNQELLIDFLAKQLKEKLESYTILVKGSRSSKMESIVNSIVHDSAFYRDQEFQGHR